MFDSKAISLPTNQPYRHPINRLASQHIYRATNLPVRKLFLQLNNRNLHQVFSPPNSQLFLHLDSLLERLLFNRYNALHSNLYCVRLCNHPEDPPKHLLNSLFRIHLDNPQLSRLGVLPYNPVHNRGLIHQFNHIADPHCNQRDSLDFVHQFNL